MTSPYSIFPNAYGNQAYNQPVMRDQYIPQAPQQNNFMIWAQGSK